MKSRVLKSAKLAFAAAVLGALGWGSYQAARFARTDPFFEVKQFSISGLKRVAENEVVAQAHVELGTNIFTADLDEVRLRVESLQWVRHALVQRILPDQIVITVVEREPIGLSRIAGEIFEFDTDARILDLDSQPLPSFPVLDGLRMNDPQGNAVKVDLYRKIIDELQGQTELSEIHINDAHEVAVVSVSDPMLVNLGDTDFRTRWVRYLRLKSEIQRKYPDAVLVDFRFRDQVIVKMRQEETEDTVVWGAGKKSL